MSDLSHVSQKTLRNGPYIQVALDLIDLSKAIRIAREVSQLSERIILEVGTPLIKMHGMLAVSVMSSFFPDRIIVADMKTMDAGYLEAEMAYSHGAFLSTVLGLADEETIKEALKAANEMGRLLQADLINVKEPIRKAKELEKLGVHVIGLHAGIDQQSGRKLRALDLLETLEQIDRETNCLISIAGGIRPEEVRLFKKAGADIIVIGSAITSSENPRAEAEKALKELI